MSRDRLRTAKPVEVESYNNAAAGQVAAEVITESGLVSPAVIAHGNDDLVLLQLGQRWSAVCPLNSTTEAMPGSASNCVPGCRLHAVPA